MPTPKKKVIRDPRLPKAGTILERTFKGETVKCKVLKNGFKYEGETYTSLSAVANAATGGVWNGYVFFRLNKKLTNDNNAGGAQAQ